MSAKQQLSLEDEKLKLSELVASIAADATVRDKSPDAVAKKAAQAMNKQFVPANGDRHFTTDLVKRIVAGDIVVDRTRRRAPPSSAAEVKAAAVVTNRPPAPARPGLTDDLA